MTSDVQKGPIGVIVVDVQGDFTECRQGSLAVPGTDETYLDRVEQETRRFKAMGYTVFATQDWHPENHVSFFSNHENARVFDEIKINGKSQVLWPPHCIQGTPNARVLVDNTLFDAIVQKGTHPDYDSYSGFFDDGGDPTGLETILRKRGIKRLIVYGLATDYCVRATVIDALSLGFETVLIEGLCRGVAQSTTRAALGEMAAAGGSIE